MNKLFTKITSLALGAAMMIGVGVAVGSKSIVEEANAASYSYTFTSKQFTANETVSLGGVSWTLSGDGNYWGYDGTKGQQFGSGSAPYKSLSLSTSGISGNISQIVVNASGASKVSATISCTVGGNNFGTQSQSISSSASNKTFSGSASGTIDITMSQTSSKALYIKTISVTYSSDPASLAAPTGISYNSTTQKVTWNAVTGATGYQYTLDNGSTWTAVTSFAERYLSVGNWTDGDYNLKLRANGNGTDYVTNGTASDNYAFTKQESPTYTGVTVTPGSLVGNEKGTAYIDLTATVQGTHSPSQVVSWKITSDTTYVDQTSISGKASIASTDDSTGRVTFDDNFTGYAWAVAADGTTKNYAQVVASGLIDAKGSQNNPYTVAEARYALDNEGKVADVYAKGIVSSIVTAYSTQYKNVTYNLSDDGTTSSDQLQAFRLSSATDPGVKVGDVITVTGSLTIYGSTYEFGAGCTLYRHAQIQSLTVTTSPDNEYDAGETFNPAGLVVSASYNNGEQNHSFSFANHESNFVFDPDTSTPLTSTDEVVAITYGNGEVSFPIEVTVAPAVISVEVDPSSKTAYFEDEFNISATVTAEGGASEAITWSIEDNSSLISIKSGTATNTSVTIVAGTTVGTAYVRATSDFNNQIYARCKVDVKDPDALVDTINRELTGVASGATSYSNWSGKSDSTSAVYAGNSAGSHNSIQIRSGAGFYNTASAGYVRQFDVTFNENTSSGRTVTIYGYETARSSIDTSGTNLGSASYNGTDSTFTINVDAQYEFEYFVLTANGALYMDEVLVTYEKIDTDPSIMLIGPTNLSGKENTSDSTSLSVKVKNIASPEFSYSFDEGGQTGKTTSSYVSVSENTPTGGIYPLTVNFDHAGSSRVHINVSGQTAYFDVTVVEVSYISANLPAQYRLVDDVASLTSGDTLVLAEDTKNEIMCNTSVKAGETLAAESVTILGAKILTLPSDAAVLTLGGSSGAWTLTNASGKYLSVTTSNTRHLQFVDSAVTLGISISDGFATISSSSGNSVRILLNASAEPNRFSTYSSATSASMLLPKIYKHVSGQKNVEIDSDLLSAISSAQSTFSCNDKGTSFDGTSFNNMAQYFTNTIKGKYFLDYADSNESGNVAERWLAMYDYAVGKYGADYDFLGRIASGKIQQKVINPISLFNSENSAGTIAVIVVSLIGVSALGGFFFLRKRKEI